MVLTNWSEKKKNQTNGHIISCVFCKVSNLPMSIHTRFPLAPVLSLLHFLCAVSSFSLHVGQQLRSVNTYVKEEDFLYGKYAH